MWWFSGLGTLLLATALMGLPLDDKSKTEIVPASLEKTTPSTELSTALTDLPLKDKSEDEIVPASLEDATLSTELLPPSLDDLISKREGPVYLINLAAVTNVTDLEDEEKLTDDIIDLMPAIIKPSATIFLVVEVIDEEAPVSLDEVAQDLEEEGFTIKKIAKDGETKIVRVDFNDDLDDDTDDKTKDTVVVEKNEQPESTTMKVRRKRAPCLKCKLGNLLGGGGGGGYGGYGGGYGGGGYPSGGGGGCGNGCGGGGGYPSGGRGNTVGVIPVVVVPVSGYSGGGGQRPSGGYYPSGGGGQGYYPSGGGGGHHHHHHGGGGGQCNTCGGQGGGGGGGGGGSWSQSSAQASAQSSSGSW